MQQEPQIDLNQIFALLVGHPDWEQPRRARAMAEDPEQLARAVHQTFGPQSELLLAVPAKPLADALAIIGERDGFLVSSDDGQELFIECDTEELALSAFEDAAGKPAISSCQSQLLREMLAECLEPPHSSPMIISDELVGLFGASR